MLTGQEYRNEFFQVLANNRRLGVFKFHRRILAYDRRTAEGYFLGAMVSSSMYGYRCETVPDDILKTTFREWDRAFVFEDGGLHTETDCPGCNRRTSGNGGAWNNPVTGKLTMQQVMMEIYGGRTEENKNNTRLWKE